MQLPPGWAPWVKWDSVAVGTQAAVSHANGHQRLWCFCAVTCCCRRDLKPENFLLTGKTGDAELKLTDFGLGRHQQRRETSASTQASAEHGLLLSITAAASLPHAEQLGSQAAW